MRPRPAPGRSSAPAPMSMSMSMSMPIVIAAVAVTGVFAVGCTDEDAGRTAPQVFDVTAQPMLDLTPAASTGVVMTAGELEGALSDLLGRHAELVAAVMVGAADGTDVDTEVEELQRNTRSLTDAIGVVYGPVGAAAFDQLWSQHTQFFADYATAAGDGDTEARDEAEQKLDDYHMDFSSFTDTATAGNAPVDVVAGLLHTHVADLTGFIDAHVEGDRVEEQARLDAATSYMSVIAGALAGAIAAQDPARFPA